MTVSTTRLDNGITVVTDSMTQLHSVAIGVWVGAGSRHESDTQQGISHFLEHMAFKGTENRNARQIAEQIETVGGEVNAATSLENTAYYVRILKDDIALAVDLLADILFRSRFEPSEIAREQHVILQEIGASHDMPEDRVFDMLMETAFPDQPIGRPILGTTESVSSFNADDLRNYLAKHYHGPAMVIAAAGAVDHQDLVDRVAQDFSLALPTSVPELSAAHYHGGDHRETRDLMETQIVLGFEGYGYSHPDYYGAQVLAGVLGGGMSSRLFQEIREKHGLCYSIYALHWAFHDTGLFAIHTASGGEDLEALIPLLAQELRRLTHDISEEELIRARTQARAGLLMALESPAARASQIARQTMLYGKPQSIDNIMAQLDAVSVADLCRIADQIISGSAMTLAAVGHTENLASYDDIQAMIAN